MSSTPPPLDQAQYKNNPFVYWFLWIFVLLYTCLVTVWVVIYVQNISITHTWFENPGMPGVMLTSLRGSFTSIMLKIAIVIHPCIPFAIMFLIAYRRNVVWSFTTLAIMGIAWLICIFSLIVLGDQYSHCNGQNQYGNLCNDPKWCCVHEILENRANKCPNTVDCAQPLTFDDIGANETFLGLFWIHFTMTFLQMVFFGVMVAIWRSPKPIVEEYEEEEEADYEPSTADFRAKAVSEMIPAAAVTQPKKRVHGLRQRTKKQ